jgi:GT2 family glycosyltransferase
MAPGAKVGCVAPLLMNADGSEQASVGDFPTLGGLVRDRFRPRELRKYVIPQPKEARPVDWASGACLLVKREAFEAVGGFDEKYFLYVEELDFQRRLSERGYATWFVPEAKVMHHAPNAGRAARRDVQRWAARGMLRYFAKFGSSGQLLGYRVMAVTSGRLGVREGLARRGRILERGTQ